MEIGLDAKLFSALHGNRDDEVIKLCSMAAEGPFHIITIHNETVLHAAAYLKKFQLANELLDHLPEDRLTRLAHKDDWGCTLLHDAASSNKGIGFICKVLLKAPELLLERNKWGESAVFQATRYGRGKMFKFLACEVDKFCESHRDFDRQHFFQRQDKTTVLHMSILIGKFDMALMIARRYPDLCTVRAQDLMTALQILACNPTAFKSVTKLGFFKELIYSCVSTDERGTVGDEAGQSFGIILKALSFIFDIARIRCKLPIIESVREVKRGHKDALELVKVLVQSDFSWKMTNKPDSEVKPVITASISGDKSAAGDPSFEPPQERAKDETSQLKLAENKSVGGEELVDSFSEQEDSDIESCKTSYRSSITNTDETPLLLATRKGCIEIVEETLNIYPQSVAYFNRDGHTLLHLAVKYRHLSIFQLVQRKNMCFMGLIRVIDRKGNSILHMVGSKKEASVDVKMKSPVLQLSEDLLLLEYMKTLCPGFLENHHNNEMMTADALFAMNNEKLRNEAKEWLKRTAEHCTVIIVLIATVAFAAAYTVPGGPNQTTGVPLLLGQPFFLVFTMTDVLSLGFALTAVVIFLAILTSSFQLKDFRRSLPQKLLLGFTLLFLSVSMMMVSFAATIILMIHNRERWTKIAVYSVAFFPVSIFVLSYIPLYIQLVDTFKYWVKKIGKSLPRCERAPTPARLSSSSSNVHHRTISSSPSSSIPLVADSV